LFLKRSFAKRVKPNRHLDILSILPCLCIFLQITFWFQAKKTPQNFKVCGAFGLRMNFSDITDVLTPNLPIVI
jgi:hypothetical protein